MMRPKLRSKLLGVLTPVNSYVDQGSAALDPLAVAPVVALSFRKLLTGYLGPAVRLRRASDSAEADFGFVAGDGLDVASITNFLAATSGFVKTLYDQSGNGQDATQGTAANQPAFTLADATMNNKPSMTFGNAGNRALQIAQSALNDSIFTSAAGGFASFVMNYAAGAVTQPGRIFSKAAQIVDFQNNSVPDNKIRFVQQSTAAGVWVTTNTLSAGAHIVDLAYSSNALANDPVIAFDGSSQTFGTDTNPTGTISNDTGILYIGNIAAGARGFNGSLSEVIFWKANLPSAGQKTTLRAGQKAYWGTA